MSDYNREELIEKAAQAICHTTEHPDQGHVDWPDIYDAREIAEAVLAVFEQAHTPTSDEQAQQRSTPSDCVTNECDCGARGPRSGRHRLSCSIDAEPQSEPTAAENNEREEKP